MRSICPSEKGSPNLVQLIIDFCAGGFDAEHPRARPTSPRRRAIPLPEGLLAVAHFYGSQDI